MTIAAISRHAERLREDAEQRQAERDRQMQEYSSLLLDDPDKHAERIAELMFALDLSPERVESDVSAIREARRLQGLAGNAGDAERAYRDELQRAAAMKFVAEQRQRVDQYRKVDCRNYADAAKRAAGELANLAESHPHLFSTADGTPRLHGDDVASQSDETAAARKVEVMQSRLLRVEKEMRTATAKLEKDINSSDRCQWSAWKRELQREQRKLQKQIEQLDDASTDAGDAGGDE